MFAQMGHISSSVGRASPQGSRNWPRNSFCLEFPELTKLLGGRMLMEFPPGDFVGVSLSELMRKRAGWEAARL